jgi:prepilin-type N-terminal cleavage/methylation domain-containing protein
MRRRGFTLVELLLAMSLLVAFGALLLRFVGGALDVWRRTETQRELAEKATTVFEMLGRDLRSVLPLRLHESPRPNRARFQAELATVDRDGDRVAETVLRRLRFVSSVDPAQEWRTIAGLLARLPRRADAEGETRIVADAPGDGLAEVAWATAADRTGEDLALLSLYRGARPLVFDPKGSFFREGFFAAPTTFGEDLREVAAGVLDFALLFPVRGVVGWADVDADRPSAAACACWESTRGLPLDLRSHPANKFPHEKGEASAAEPRDDVFPARVLATLVLERGGPGRFPKLTQPVGPAERVLEVDDARGLPRTTPFLAKVDGEWVEVSGVAGKTLSLGKRGTRETPAAPHAAGSRVHVGEAFRAEFPLEVGREAGE